jgi:hypothetical protein
VSNLVPAGGQQRRFSEPTQPLASSGCVGAHQTATVGENSPTQKRADGPSPEFSQLCEYGLRLAKGHRPTRVSEDQVFTAVMFLSQFRPTKRGTYDSYFLKHEAERWGGRNGMCSYISNGALIAAALCLGLVIDEYLSCFPTSPNAKIGISKRGFKRFAQGK